VKKTSDDRRAMNQRVAEKFASEMSEHTTGRARITRGHRSRERAIVTPPFGMSQPVDCKVE